MDDCGGGGCWLEGCGESRLCSMRRSTAPEACCPDGWLLMGDFCTARLRGSARCGVPFETCLGCSMDKSLAPDSWEGITGALGRTAVPADCPLRTAAAASWPDARSTEGITGLVATPCPAPRDWTACVSICSVSSPAGLSKVVRSCWESRCRARMPRCTCEGRTHAGAAW